MHSVMAVSIFAFSSRTRLPKSLLVLKNCPRVLFSFSTGNISTPGNGQKAVKGLVIGGFTDYSAVSRTVAAKVGSVPTLTHAGQTFDKEVQGKLSNLLNLYVLKKDIPFRLFYDLHEEYKLVCVVDLGSINAGYNALEEVDEKKENIRKAVAAGFKHLVDAGANKVLVDTCGDEETVAEAVRLMAFCYDELKAEKSRINNVEIEPFGSSSKAWLIGELKANAQNFARYLAETPANFMTPAHFAQKVEEKVKNLNIELRVRDKQWAEQQKMGAFLSVSHGSHVPPLLVELHYKGADESQKPIVLVGKGITFDSGGISLKSASGMDEMRADMEGAAVVVSVLYAIASLKLKLNVIGITPLSENMPGGSATKPGDVVRAMNGTTIQVDNTDAEGRLILADGLAYAQTFKPKFIMDLATLTGAMCISLAASATGVFTNDSALFSVLHKAGHITGDRVWRMPVFEYFSKKVRKCDLADLNNIAGKGYGGSCIAAAFLKEFVGDFKWMHLDIAGVMQNEDDVPYMGKGMSGRPTRTLVEFLRSLESEGSK